MSHINLLKIKIFSAFLATTTILPLHAQERFSIQDLTYQGATRFIDVVSGESRLGFANGNFAINKDTNTVYIVGHEKDQAIAEYQLNDFSTSLNLEELPMAGPVLQGFSKVLNRADQGNPESIDTITGLQFIEETLVVNGATYYNASGSNSDTTLIIRNPKDISNSTINGFYELEGATHAAGWMTPIPETLREKFNADYIFGFASNLPINTRNSIGPSAFAVDSNSLLTAPNGATIPTTTLLDFSTTNPLHPDAYNETGQNKLWTEVSKAYVGFIVPGTETYAVFGSSAGHEYGIGYKIEQDTGNVCGGPCAKVAGDRYNFYWLWDINDMIAVKNGQLPPYALKPYDYGELTLPFERLSSDEGPNLMTGAYYESKSQNLYILLGEADRLQSQYEPTPILLKYEINFGRRPEVPTNIEIK